MVYSRASRKAPWRTLSLRIIFAVAWTLFAAEMYLRLFHPIPMLPRYIIGTELGIRGNMPSQSYWHNTPDYKVNIRSNSKGVRADEEIPYEKRNGTKRIVVLGDSFGMGYGVAIQDTFLAQMERRLEDWGIDCEVVNLCVSGHGNAEELVVLEHEGIKYQPDLVLLVWHKTDLDDNVRSGLFALQDGRLVRKNRTYLPAVHVREFLFRFGAYRWIAGNSHLYNWLRDAAGKQAKKALVNIRGGIPVKTQRSNPPAVTTQHEPQLASYRERLTVALLKAIESRCAEQGASLVILDVPTRVSRTKFDSSFPCQDGGGTFGLNVVSPLDVFRQHRGDLLFWERSHFHFTPLGCQLVGQALADSIIEGRLLH